jgi:hypothetical protein
MANFTRTSPDIQKVLFVLLQPGFIRFYNGVIANLIKRGCYVSVTFTHVHKKMGGLDGLPFDQGDLAIDCREFPKRTDVWRGFAKGLRLADSYLTYLNAEYRDADYLRRRYEKDLPCGLKVLTWLPALPRPVVHGLQRGLRAIERIIPPVPEIIEFLKEHEAYIVVLSPMVEREIAQIEVVKAARAMGLHTVLAVGSWDHLTTKRTLTLPPDKVLVWNEKQKDEAIRLHNVPADDIVVTGAPIFDQWFGRKPLISREKFFERAGLTHSGPLIVYAGSSPQIVAGEAEVDFVRRWRAALQAKLPERYRDINVLVRPHPVNYAHWETPGADVAVFPPPVGTNPANKSDQSDYFHTLHYADAVFGLNTSACVEAAICGTPSLTVVGEADARQTDTLHFRLLTPEEGGPMLVAHDFDEHVIQLVDMLDNPAAHQARLLSFVEHFVRPRGLEERAVVQMSRAVTDIGWTPPPAPQRRSLLARAAGRVIAALLKASHRAPTAEELISQSLVARRTRKREGLFTAEVKSRRSRYPETGPRARYIRPGWQLLPYALDPLADDDLTDEEEEEEGLTA